MREPAKSEGAKGRGRRSSGTGPARRRWICGVAAACGLGLCGDAGAVGLDYDDVQLCTNAYNGFWFGYESIKSSMRNAPPADEAAALLVELSKVVNPNFHFGLVNLPLPPTFTTTASFAVDGIENLANLAASIGNFGEHHVATPFSVNLVGKAGLNRTYSMITRDVAYTRDNIASGGCTAYLSQKEAICTVKNQKLLGLLGKPRKALLDSLVDNVVTSYQIPAPQCSLWIEAPIPAYP